MKKTSSAVSSAESSSMENRVMKIIISSFSARNTLKTWGNSCDLRQVAEDLVEEKAEHQHEEEPEEQEEEEFFLLAAHQGIAQLQEFKLQQAFHGCSTVWK